MSSRSRAFAALATAGCLWGTGFLFGKWALTELSVGQMVLYRFLFASLGFAPATWRGLRRAETRIARRDVPLFFSAALLGVPVQFVVQFAGLDRTTVSHASLMVGNLPVLLAAGVLATTVTTYLWNWGLARVPASQACVFVNLEPVVGAILGVVLLHDILGPYALIGGLLVVGAALFVATARDS